ncbi:MAG: chemotaxis protein CheX [Planctomycetes bacterium]|nr:chemotaxis protein CheX [Planctomycetota bacterium]
MLTRIFSEVLANLAFLFPEPASEPAGAEGPWLESTIAYEGTHRGMLKLVCTDAFAALLAENLLGAPSGDTPLRGRMEDAIKELMNIVCGQLMTAAFGAQEMFNLGIPEIKAVAVLESRRSGLEVHRISFVVEELPVHLTWAEVDAAEVIP